MYTVMLNAFANVYSEFLCVNREYILLNEAGKHTVLCVQWDYRV